MVADLCHFVISFCRCEITIVFVFSPQNNDLTAKLTRNNEINEAISAAKYFAPLFIVFSPWISNNLRLFVISSWTDEITKRRKLPSFRSEKTINTGANYFAALLSHSLVSLLRVWLSFAVISLFVAKTRSRKDEDYHYFAAAIRNDKMAQFNHHRRRPSAIYFAITWIRGRI